MAKTKKQPKPTMSQYSYMVTGLLTGTIKRGVIITDEIIKQAVEITRKASCLSPRPSLITCSFMLSLPLCCPQCS